MVGQHLHTDLHRHLHHALRPTGAGCEERAVQAHDSLDLTDDYAYPICVHQLPFPVDHGDYRWRSAGGTDTCNFGSYLVLHLAVWIFLRCFSLQGKLEDKL